MSQKLFVLGLPGSGKSTVSRYIVDYIRRFHDDWSATRLCDYDILRSMFVEDTAQKHFYATEYNGFYVKDSSIYDVALKKLEKMVEDCNFAENEFVIVEFARSDYLRALNNFSQSFLQGAYFLFLDVNVDLGMKRVKDRVKHPIYSDDHFVSKYTFEFYRQKDNFKYLSSVSQHLTNRYGIKPCKIKIVDNKGSKRDFWEPVNKTILQLLEEAPIHTYV
jgi:adenylate kinase family enzyme